VGTGDEIVEVRHGRGQWWRHELRCSSPDQRGEHHDTYEARNGHHRIPPVPGTRRAFAFVDWLQTRRDCRGELWPSGHRGFTSFEVGPPARTLRLVSCGGAEGTHTTCQQAELAR